MSHTILQLGAKSLVNRLWELNSWMKEIECCP